MTNQQERQLLKSLYRNLQNSPLESTDDFYVPLLEQADNDPIQDIFTSISFGDSQSVSLLTGQRGTGKSTELLRLKKLLAADDAHVFLVDLSEHMHMNIPVDITDFLITLMAAFSEQVSAFTGVDISKESYLTRINEFLQQEVDVSQFNIKLTVANIKGALKQDPNFKLKLQQKLKGHANRLVSEAHDFCRQAVAEVREKYNDPNKKVVLLIDSLEQVRGIGLEAGQVHQSVENLFKEQATSLMLPYLHVLYTVPPYIAPLASNIATVLGSDAIFNLPSIHIRDKFNHPDEKGLALMREIIAKRSADWEKMFSAAQLDNLAKSSGGDLRNFFRLIRLSLTKAASTAGIPLPVQDDVIKRAENQIRSEFFITEQDRIWLKKIHDTKHHHMEDIENLPQLARFLDSDLVLSYRNGEEWYDVHPLAIDKL